MKTLKDFQGQRMNLKQMNNIYGGGATSKFNRTATYGDCHDVRTTVTDEDGKSVSTLEILCVDVVFE